MDPEMERRGITVLVMVALAGCGGGGTTPDASAGDAAEEDTAGPPADGGPGGSDGAAEAPGAKETGGDDGGTCSLIACGGEVTGSWQLGGTCYGMGPPLSKTSMCPRQVIDDSGLDTTGELVFKADMTYTLSLVNNGISILRYDTTCPQYTCDGLRTSLGAGVTCEEAANVCTCRVPYKDDVEQESGSYRLDQSFVTFKPQGLSEHRHLYCVSGGDLKMSVNLATGPGGEPASDGVYRLTKR
jgi:hypothetical protein